MVFLSSCSFSLTGGEPTDKHNALENRVDKILEKANFNGVVQLSISDEVIYEKCRGYIDRKSLEGAVKEKKTIIPKSTDENEINGTTDKNLIRVDDVFELASLTKQMTAAAVLKLYDEGKLDLDDTIEEYFKDYSHASEITIAELLNMVSGIPDYVTSKDSDTDIEPYDYICSHSLNFTPGKKYEYSNSNYYLLGKIIEKVSGTTYEEYMKENFFDKLGMYNTDFGISEDRVLGIDLKGKKSGQSYPYDYVYSAGGIISNVPDLFQWEKAYFSGEVISKRSMNALTDKNNPLEYMYGWGRTGSILYHEGSDMNFRTGVLRDTESNIQIILLSNVNTTDISDLLKAIDNAIEVVYF